MNGKLCGARTRAKTKCRRWSMVNGRCSEHGGKSLAWFAHPRYKHGHFSKYSAEAHKYRAEVRHAGCVRRFEREAERRGVQSEEEALTLWYSICRLPDLRRRVVF